MYTECASHWFNKRQLTYLLTYLKADKDNTIDDCRRVTVKQIITLNQTHLRSFVMLGWTISTPDGRLWPPSLCR